MKRDTNRHTVVIGGGLAGLAAAGALGRHGQRVTLLESRAWLGGRASSYTDPRTGEVFDNCQHVAMGCCTNFLHFCSSHGLDGRLRTEETLHFAGPDGRISRFSAGRLPAPLHLATGFRRLGHLTARDRRAIVRGLFTLARRRADPSLSFADWLADQKQPRNAIEGFWDVVLVSALSDSAKHISTDYARQVFVDGFLSHRHGWHVVIPQAPLSVLYGEALVESLARSGVTVRCGTRVRSLQHSNGHVTGVECQSGERLSADDVILAVAPPVAAEVLSAESLYGDEVRSLNQLQYAPITSVHLRLDRPITPLPHVAFVGRTIQWLFNRDLLQHQAPASAEGHNYQVVISGSHDLRTRSQQDVTALVLDETAAVFPALQQARLLEGRVITEQRAVFSPRPGVDEIRPPQQSSVPNLQLAGDWTRTGWPATMEGAVRSGYLAAENVLSRRGQTVSLLVPGLTAGLLPRLLGVA